MTRHDIQTGIAALAIVVMLGLVIGFAVGSITGSRHEVFPMDLPGEAAFDEMARTDDRGSGSQGLPGWSDLYVNDYADLLSDDVEARVRADLVELYDETGVEMTVLTIPDMLSYRWTGRIEGFATALFNDWGIGDATRNDGVLILVSRYDREMRIELGAGYGNDRNADMQRVIDGAFLPAFRRDAYEEGIERGVEETIFEIAGVYPGGYGQGTIARGWSVIFRRALDLGVWLLAPLGVAGGTVALAFRRYLRNRPRPCPSCGTTMLRAGETADDAHLDGGQRLEEYLGSVDYDVWHCPSCAHITIHGYKSWVGRHSTCPSCGYRTLETTSEVLEAATQTSTGRKRLDYSCKQCGHHDSEVRTIPRLTESSGSGGGGRSSFGGGRSSGGGASGSW